MIANSLQSIDIHVQFTAPTRVGGAGVKLRGRGSHWISDPAPLVWDPLPLITDPTTEIRHLGHSLYSSMFLCARCLVRKCSPSRSFCHLHQSVLGVDRCCKRQTLFKWHKCHKSQTDCLECSKTPGRRSGTPPLCSWSFGFELQPFKPRTRRYPPSCWVILPLRYIYGRHSVCTTWHNVRN